MANIQTCRKALLLFDTHGEWVDKRVWELAKAFRKDFKPHRTIAGGDWGNYEYGSTFKDESELGAKQEYARVRQQIDDMGVTDFIDGNHEARMRRYGGAIDKRLRALLDVRANLEVDKRGIKWYPYNESGVLRLGKLRVLHGFWCNQYAARTHADAFGCCAFGHTHRFQTFMPKQAEVRHTGFNIGCMCQLKMPWNATRGPNGWTQGFAFVYIHKSGHFNLYPVRLVGTQFVINGKEYQL